jgi:hypothetical protein
MPSLGQTIFSTRSYLFPVSFKIIFNDNDQCSGLYPKIILTGRDILLAQLISRAYKMVRIASVRPSIHPSINVGWTFCNRKT